jgi:hypothetical protein
MEFLDTPPSRQLFYLTACISLLVHVVLLLMPMPSPPARTARQRLNVRMAPQTAKAVTQPVTPQTPTASLDPSQESRPRQRKATTASNRPVLTSPALTSPAMEMPHYSQAERDNIDNFLQSLGPKPQTPADARTTLSERSLAMARDIGKEFARQPGDAGAVSVERIPNSPPLDRFNLEFYLDSLVNKLNRNAKFMKQPESGGHQTAAVQLRINPDGTVKSLEVLDESDQKEEVEFIKRLLERSAPYSPFPPAIAASAKSMAITICIKPGQSNGFGFSRYAPGDADGC